jgi:ubiquinol-cytochrome c reductase cytochrome c subunit
MHETNRTMKLFLAFAAIATTAVVSLAALQAQTPAAPAPAAPAGNADTGKKLYVSVGCYQCHGYEGQGGAAGPRLAPRPLPYAGFSRYVRRPTNQMPPYTERLVPDADLAHIYAYLQSRPMPPAAATIPLLQ